MAGLFRLLDGGVVKLLPASDTVTALGSVPDKKAIALHVNFV